MGLLKSVNNVSGINYYEYRDNYFWGKFKYRARVFIPGARFLYYTNNIDAWRHKINNPGIYNKLSDEQKTRILNKECLIKNFMLFREENKISKCVAIRIEGDLVAIFSNNLSSLHKINTWDTKVTVDFTESILGQYEGVKYFVREPKNKYRVYLKSKRVDENEIEQLKELLARQPLLIPSKGFSDWLSHKKKNTWRYRFCSATFFIDYNDESMLSYLILCHNEIIGKKFKLQKRN